MTKTFYSNGKLLLTAEYAVLDGAKALAIPTKYGQSMVVLPWDQSELIWTSLNHTNKVWYDNCFSLNKGEISTEKEDAISLKLLELLTTCQRLNSKFLSEDKGYLVISRLDFPNNWGLGSSSTLINNLALWADVNPYHLLKETFGGSGYDIACAQHQTPIVYQRTNGQPKIELVTFAPEFSKHLYFLHLNKKESSKDAITHYTKTVSLNDALVLEISQLTDAFLNCNSFDELTHLMLTHERLMSKLLNLPTVKSRLFSDFNGYIKSLGAWGGDFVLVAARENPQPYFKSKGYETLIAFDDMILQ